MLIPVGPFAVEINTPTKASGARITLTRESWPVGALFNYRVYERNRNSSQLMLITSGSIMGGSVPRRDGQPGDADLVIQLNWAVDKDKDVIRFEADVFQAFNTTPSLEWL